MSCYVCAAPESISTRVVVTTYDKANKRILNEIEIYVVPMCSVCFLDKKVKYSQEHRVIDKPYDYIL